MNWVHYEVSDKIKINSFVSAFEMELNNGFSFTGESHNFWEMMYVSEGNVCVSSDDCIFELSENEIIFHKPMELHKFHIANGSHAKILVMSFDLCGECVSSLENLSIRLLAHQKDLLYNILSLLRKNSTKNPDVYLKYITALKTQPLFSQQLACTTELFLLSVIDSSSVVTMSNTPDAAVFKKSVHLMEAFIEDWISVPSIAKECNVSISYLKKIFNKYAGLGVHKYFLKMKIIRASALLKEGKSVTEVSDTLNFSSQNYFSIVFKRETGVSPLSYKRNT